MQAPDARPACADAQSCRAWLCISADEYEYQYFGLGRFSVQYEYEYEYPYDLWYGTAVPIVFTYYDQFVGTVQ